ncbi:transcriptional regulator with XRE-family HTH domain [Bradyrhizobium barranii subsp. barranii]|uniref:helix-turn-helix domain-containing protein n=1 Tax=Bradyrhizobium liaoningense TaxID=43992 RepID=UPI001BA77E0C|nr:helix-turn-helix transcriptional regulator [Bradyrhizobium liaoningense]MBR0879087.1 helix-turn-helix transcriptional regulator [Bradyrhizobium liaoningense]
MPQRKPDVRPNRGPTDSDVLVGQRIRRHRMERGLSQTQLGKALGVSFQQIQKYEKGANRVGAIRLQQIAAELGTEASILLAETGRHLPSALDEFLATKEGHDLFVAVMRIRSDPKLLRAVVRSLDVFSREAVSTDDG